MAERGYFIGSVGRFKRAKEDWAMNQKRLEVWFKANKISDNDKVNVFLAKIGPETFEVENHITPADPSEKSYQELINIMQQQGIK